jgi:hypothetical protein
MGRYNGDSGLFTYAEYKNRGVIKLAPDVLVFISSNLGTTVVAPVKGVNQKVDFRDGITSVSVQNNVDPPGSSSASIEVIAPIQEDDSNYWITLKGANGSLYKYPYFQPMMEVKIYFRGRFLVDDTPRYYPAFWGFITNVEENYSNGVYKFNLQCADMLHWWSYSQVLFRTDVAAGTVGPAKTLSVYGSCFQGANAFEIIYALVEQMGFETYVVPKYLSTITPADKKFDPGRLNNYWSGMMGYWRMRFKTVGNYLKMYGARGTLINDPNVHPTQESFLDNPGHPAEQTIDKAILASRAIYLERYDVDDKFTKHFMVYEMLNKLGIDQAEYLSKLDIAIQVKTAIEYEFFQDVNGNFIFKPPFWNLNTKDIPPYRIKPTDIINYSFGVNSEEIVTSLEVRTGLLVQLQTENGAFDVQDVGYHMDLDLTNRFGERYQQITVQYMTDTGLTQSLAVGHLSKINARAYTGSVTIPGRPEMKLGYPVYIEHKDKYYYVTSINHSFDFGGSFTTTLSLNAERPRVYGLNEKSREWEIQKNKIYIWDSSGSTDVNQTSEQQASVDEKDPVKKQETLLRGANFINSLKTGFYKIKGIEEMTDAGTKSTPTDYSTIQRNSVPYTDEEGYKVIGSFRYGRGIVLKGGTVIDSPELELSKLNAKDPDNYAASKQAENINNMKAASDEEGAAMDQYFKTNKNAKPNPIETVIPDYLHDIPVDTDAQVQMVINAVTPTETPIGGEVSSPLTEKIQNEMDSVTAYTRSKIPGAAPAPGVPGDTERIAANVSKYDKEIQTAVDNQSLNIPLPYRVTFNELKALIMTESRGNSIAVSPKGAAGLTQIMPGTFDDINKHFGYTLNKNNVQDQITAGAYYLGQQKQEFHGDISLAYAGYNAGPGAVYGHLRTVTGKPYDRPDVGTPKVPPYTETENYVVTTRDVNLVYLENKDKQRNQTPTNYVMRLDRT